MMIEQRYENVQVLRDRQVIYDEALPCVVDPILWHIVVTLRESSARAMTNYKRNEAVVWC